MSKTKGFETDQKAKDAFRKFLVKGTHGCVIQGGYPCGTCTVHFLETLGLDPHGEGYDEHNEDVDRTNEMWRGILQIRETDEVYVKNKKEE